MPLWPHLLITLLVGITIRLVLYTAEEAHHCPPGQLPVEHLAVEQQLHELGPATRFFKPRRQPTPAYTFIESGFPSLGSPEDA